MESCLSKNNITLKKAKQPTEKILEEQTKPQAFTPDENQKKVEEKGTLRIKNASKTTLISSSISNANPPVAIKAPEGATRRRRAAKKPRGKFSSAKIKILMAIVSLPFSRMPRIDASSENTIRATHSGLSHLFYSLC
jgi:hypothetical protein